MHLIHYIKQHAAPQRHATKLFVGFQILPPGEPANRQTNTKRFTSGISTSSTQAGIAGHQEQNQPQQPKHNQNSLEASTEPPHGLVPSNRNRTYAVLVDAMNCEPYNMNCLLEKIRSMGGNPCIRRVYGDFSAEAYQKWKDASQAFSFLPVQTFHLNRSKGNQASHVTLLVDAMELFHTNSHLKGFALVSNNGHFGQLATRLREGGKHVIGVGHESMTESSFASSCSLFIQLEQLHPSHSDDQGETSSPLLSNQIDLIRAFSFFRERIQSQALQDKNADGWVSLTMMSTIVNSRPEYLPRKLGYPTYRKLFLAFPDQFDVKVENGKSYVRSIPIHHDVTPALSYLRSIIQSQASIEKNADGWVSLSTMSSIAHSRPEYLPRKLGFTSYRKLFQAFPNQFDVKIENEKSYVRCM